MATRPLSPGDGTALSQTQPDIQVALYHAASLYVNEQARVAAPWGARAVASVVADTILLLPHRAAPHVFRDVGRSRSKESQLTFSLASGRRDE
jgi:hypothetical protein